MINLIIFDDNILNNLSETDRKNLLIYISKYLECCIAIVNRYNSKFEQELYQYITINSDAEYNPYIKIADKTMSLLYDNVVIFSDSIDAVRSGCRFIYKSNSYENIIKIIHDIIKDKTLLQDLSKLK